MAFGKKQRLAARGLGTMVVGLGALALLMLGRREVHATETVPVERLTEVTLLRVETTTERTEHVFYGVIRTAERAMLSFTEGGRLVSRQARVGDRVASGDLLARLDPSPYLNSVRAGDAARHELELRSEQLARDRDRSARLARDGVTTRVRLEQTENGFERVEAMREAAQARFSESRRRARETQLRAPFDGIVTDMMVEPGELVSPGQPVVRLAGSGGRELLVEVPGAVAEQLGVGDEVEMRALGVRGDDPLASRTLSGRVRSVTSDAASVSGLFPVIVDVQTPTRAGLGVEATLLGPEHEALRVPLDAVLDPSGRRPYVWTVVNGRAVHAWLRLGRLDGDEVEVLGGLDPGAVIVSRGHVRLLEGDLVTGGAS